MSHYYLILTLITSTTALGLGVVLVVVSREVIKNSQEMIRASHKSAEASWYAQESYRDAVRLSQDAAEAYRLMTCEACKSYSALTQEVIESYQTVRREFSTSTAAIIQACDDTARVCEASVLAVTGTCESATALASKTCQEILHSSFPNETLNWSWHSQASFMCYYCQQRFPNTEKETIGKYDYCLAHGTTRKERMLKEECGVS